MRLVLAGVLFCVISFSAGYVYRGRDTPSAREWATAAPVSAKSAGETGESLSAPISGGRQAGGDERVDVADDQKLELDSQFLSAVLSSGRLDERASRRMGLSEPEYSAIEAAGAAAMEAFKELEKKHSQTKSDERGEFVEIKPFPSEREQWLGELEAELRSVLGDDRAAVLARMLAFADNDEEMGNYVREVFVMNREDGTMLIEERTFDQHGNLTDSDYETVGPNGNERWQHLLEFKAE